VVFMRGGILKKEGEKGMTESMGVTELLKAAKEGSSHDRSGGSLLKKTRGRGGKVTAGNRPGGRVERKGTTVYH